MILGTAFTPPAATGAATGGDDARDNLDTQAEFRITNLPADAWPDRPKATPRIWGYAVYVDMTTISPDTYNSIFVFDLPEGAR